MQLERAVPFVAAVWDMSAKMVRAVIKKSGGGAVRDEAGADKAWTR